MRNYQSDVMETEPNVPMALQLLASAQFLGSVFRDVFGGKGGPGSYKSWMKPYPTKPDYADKCPYKIEFDANGNPIIYYSSA